jgi:hypothetical protein
MGAASTLFHYIDVTIGWMLTFVGIILCPSVAGKAACGLNQCRPSLTMSAKSTGGNSVLVKDEQSQHGLRRTSRDHQRPCLLARRDIPFWKRVRSSPALSAVFSVF